MKNELNTKKFIDILQGNDFNNKFNIPKNWELDDIASATVDFVKKDSELNTYPLKPLSMVLKAYAIPLEAYFKFLETIKDINFDDKQYKNFLTDEYNNLFKEIDSSSIDDLDKLALKIEALELAEKSREKSEKNNMKGKVIIGVSSAATVIAVTATVGKVGIKYMEHAEEMARIAASASKVSSVCGVIKDVAVSAIGIVKK